jgi:glycine/D-amino acid oxidase-like deaminating enzyme
VLASPPVQNESRVDVLIVGAGFAGLMCADRLSRLGYDVLLLDSGAQMLAGTSSRNEGWLHAGTYHAQSIDNRAEAMAVARRCRYGWEEVRRRFPECVENEPRPTIVVVPDSRADEARDRWEEAGVGHHRVAVPTGGVVDGVRVGPDEVAFACDDVGINSRMLGASLAASLRTRGVRFALGARIVGRSNGTAQVQTAQGVQSVHHSFVVVAAGFGMEAACRDLELSTAPVRLWRSHLVTLPRVASRSAFSIAPDHASMINHGDWSIIGLNEDAEVVPRPTFDVDPEVAGRLARRVRERFPDADLSAASFTACVKVDHAPRPDAPRSLNVRMVDLDEDAVALLPGKMTEAPVSANVVATRVFEALDHDGMTSRPVDLLAAAAGGDNHAA